MDHRWAGRVVYPGRNHRGEIETFWARDVSGKVEDHEKYLYLKGSRKAELIAFGLDVALRDTRSRRELLIVEGVMDAVKLQSHGFSGVAAIGGDGKELGPERFEALAKFGVKRVTLLLDNDPKADGSWPGKDGTLAAIDNASRAKKCPELWVIHPSALSDCKDPDEYIGKHSQEALAAILGDPLPAARFRGHCLLEGITPASSDLQRRGAVDRVMEFVSSLRGNGAGMDRADVIADLSARTGYLIEDLAEMAESRADRKTKEEREQAIKSAIRQAQAGLEKPGRDVSLVVERLTEDLSSLRFRVADLPAGFSVDRLEMESRRLPIGKSTGLRSLDQQEIYLNAGELAIVAARPGHAKTTFLANLILHLIRSSSEASDELIVFYSFEEPEVRIFQRLIALWTAGEYEHQESSRWNPREVRDCLQGKEKPSGYLYPSSDALKEAIAQARDWESRLLIVHRPEWTVDQLAEHVRSVAQEHPVGAVFADYVQRIVAPAHVNKGRRRDEDISATGRRLKSLSVELSAPVVAAAQIGREVAKMANIPDKPYSHDDVQKALMARRPQLHQIREGGVEQEADLVLGLMNFAADYRKKTDRDGDVNIPRVTALEVGTLKNRYGQAEQWTPLAFESLYGYIRDPRPGEFV